MDRGVDWNNYTSRIKGATATDRDLLRRTVKSSVIDIGCGIGKHLAMIDDAVLKVGIDIGFYGLQKGKGMFPNILLIHGSGYQLPVKSSSLNSAIMIDVIEHFSEPRLALKEVHRVLKPRGSLFLQTPNYPAKRLYDFWHCLKGSRKRAGDDSTHVSKFTFWSLHYLVSGIGFEIRLARARNICFEKHFPVLRRLKNTISGKALGQKIVVVAEKSG